MAFLAIDTCTQRLLVGVRGATDRWLNLDSGGNHARDLLDAVQLLLEGERPQAVGVAVGPGSFTGVRIGLAAAKGLAEGWSVPLVGLDNLAAMASSWAVLCPEFQGPVLPVIDARKKKFYGALYRGAQTLLPPADLGPEAWFASVRAVWEGPVCLSGYQGALLFEALQQSLGDQLPQDWQVVPGHDWTTPLLDQLETGWRAGRFLAPDAGPRYLRLSEAEEERLKRQL